MKKIFAMKYMGVDFVVNLKYVSAPAMYAYIGWCRKKPEHVYFM